MKTLIVILLVIDSIYLLYAVYQQKWKGALIAVLLGAILDLLIFKNVV